ncbi:MAG: glycosyltransferase family 2 protein [Alphaproteobacteria bacterium]
MFQSSVCIVIAAYNAARTVTRAVSSALAQDHVNEVIVVDDASHDGTADAASSADDNTGRLRVLRTETNAGPAKARNLALRHSTSRYFCVLDADDYMLPGRLSRLLNSGAPEWDMLADDMIIVPQEQAEEPISITRGKPPTARPITLETFVRGNISTPGRPRAELGFLKPVISRAFMDRHNLFYDDLRLGEDYAFYVRALSHGARFHVVNACGYVAIERSDSLSARHTAADLKGMADFDAAMLQDAASRLGSNERAALAAHHAATWAKYAHASILERKQEAGYLAALRLLFGKFRPALPYILRETADLKLGAALRHLRIGAKKGSRSARFLIGFPDTQLNNRT